MAAMATAKICCTSPPSPAGYSWAGSFAAGRLEPPNDIFEQHIADPHGRDTDQEGRGVLRGDFVGRQRPVNASQAMHGLRREMRMSEAMA